MAYTPNTLTLSRSFRDRFGMQEWVYHTTDATGTVDGTGYFSDGVTKGMAIGDRVLRYTWTTAVPTDVPPAAPPASVGWHTVIAVSGTGATVSTETALSVTAGT